MCDVTTLFLPNEICKFPCAEVLQKQNRELDLANQEYWRLDHCLKLLLLALIAEELVMAMDLIVPGRFGLWQLDLPPWSQLLISIDPNVVSKTNLNSICYWAYAVLNNSFGPLGLSGAIILHHNWFTNFIYARSGLISISRHSSAKVWMQKI